MVIFEKLEIGHSVENFEIGRFLEKIGFGQLWYPWGYWVSVSIIFKSRGDFQEQYFDE